jgi:hypothetical protein
MARLAGNAAARETRWCASHSRYFLGVAATSDFAPDDTPRAPALTSPKRDERDVGLELLGRCRRGAGETLLRPIRQ